MNKMVSVRVFAPNGACYRVSVKEETAARLKKEKEYRDCFFYYFYKNNFKPISGEPYYNPQWESKYNEVEVPTPTAMSLKGVHNATTNNDEVSAKSSEGLNTTFPKLSPFKPNNISDSVPQSRSSKGTCTATTNNVPDDEVSARYPEGLNNLSKLFPYNPQNTPDSVPRPTTKASRGIYTARTYTFPDDEDIASPPRKKTESSSRSSEGLNTTVAKLSPFKPKNTSDSACCLDDDLGCEVMELDSDGSDHEITICGVPEPFFKDHFIFHVKKYCQETLNSRSDEKLVLSCSEPVQGSVTVQCASRAIVEEVKDKLFTIPYRNASMRIVREGGSSSTALSRLMFCNLPHPFFEDFFIFSFIQFLAQNSIVIDDSEINVVAYSAEQNSVTLEMMTAVAAKVRSLKGFVFDEKQLSINERKQRPEDPPSAAPTNLFSCSWSGPLVMRDHSDEPIDDLNDDLAHRQIPVQEDVIMLSSDKGTIIFLRNLVRLRHAFGSTNHETAYARLHADLENDEFVRCNVSDLKSKKKYLFSKYNREMKSTNSSWKYLDVIAVMKGHKEESCLDGGDFDPKKCATSSNESVASKMTKYIKGAVWFKTAIKDLIRVYGLCKRYFDLPRYHSHTWKKISEDLVESHYYYLPRQCEDKMGSLIAEYKDEWKRRQRTGAPGPSDSKDSWPYYDDMYEVMAGDISVEPSLTVASGSSNTVNVTDKFSEGRGKKQRTPPQVVPLKERSVSAMERMASSMERKIKLAEDMFNTTRSKPSETLSPSTEEDKFV